MSGRWPSRVWMIVIPSSRAAASTRCSGSTAAHSSETSLPSADPKPPGSRKSRCMSITTSAVVSGSNAKGPGSAGTSNHHVTFFREGRRERDQQCLPTGTRHQLQADRQPIGGARHGDRREPDEAPEDRVARQDREVLVGSLHQRRQDGRRRHGEHVVLAEHREHLLPQRGAVALRVDVVRGRDAVCGVQLVADLRPVQRAVQPGGAVERGRLAARDEQAHRVGAAEVGGGGTIGLAHSRHEPVQLLDLARHRRFHDGLGAFPGGGREPHPQVVDAAARGGSDGRRLRPQRVERERGVLGACRAITATWSIVHDSGTTPAVGTVPYVGLRPTTPHSAAGTRIDARVSVPSDASPIPVATAIALPPLDPPGIRVGSCGLRACGDVTPERELVRARLAQDHGAGGAPQVDRGGVDLGDLIERVRAAARRHARRRGSRP